MSKIRQVAIREIIFQLKKRDFYLSTLGVPLLGLILILAAQLSGGKPQSTEIAQTILSPSKITLGILDHAKVITQHSDLISPTKVLMLDSIQAGETALRDESIAAMYTIPADYRTTGIVTRTTRSLILGFDEDRAFTTLLMANQIQTAPVTLALRLEETMQVSKTIAINNTVRITGDLVSNPRGSSVPIMFAMGIYIAIFMGASLLMQGILEEKENRTLEILLTSVSPRQLLVGKLIGLGLVALIQLLVWIVFALIFWRNGASMFDLQAVEIPWTVWILLLVFFVLGYIFYAALMAGIGAISPSMRELSQLIIIVTVPAIVPILFLQAMLTKPNGSLALILSLIPFTAPSTMMLRQAMTVVPLWQTVLSVAVLAISTLLTIRLIARLFKASTLLVGSKLSLKQVWRALK